MRERLAVAALLLAGCSSPPDCSAFVPCGGSPVGAWRIAGTCNLPSTTSCGAQLDVTQDFRGMLTLVDDGTYALDGTVAASGHSTMPAACLAAVHDCSQLSGNLGGIQTSCSGDPQTSCTCTVDEPRGGASEIGTFTTAATSIAFAPAGDKAYGGPYCVNGNELRIQLSNSLGNFVEVLVR